MDRRVEILAKAEDEEEHYNDKTGGRGGGSWVEQGRRNVVQKLKFCSPCHPEQEDCGS